MWQIIEVYIGLIILASTVYYFAKIILNIKPKVSKKNIIILILIISLLHLIISLSFSNTSKTLLILMINMLFYKYIFDIPLKKAVFLVFLYSIILMLIDLVDMFFITKVLNIPKEQIYNEFAGGLIGDILSGIILIIVINKLKIRLRQLINARLENNTKIIIFSILVFISTVMFFYTIVKEFRFSNNILLYLIAIIVLISVLFSLIKQTIENNKLTEKYDKLLDFMTTYENEIEKERTLRHEIKNEFRTIKAKIQDKEKNKKIIEYIDDIVDDKYEVKKEEYAKFGYLPPNGIKGLCYFKMQEAEDKGIKVALSISKRVQTSNIYQLNTKQLREYGKILGVFLDNAIEASLNSEEKQIGIEAYSNKDKEFKMIITNTYHNEIDKNKIGKESFSTKGKNRGHGLLLVKHIIDNNNIFETYSDIQEKIYTQTIIVKKFEK